MAILQKDSTIKHIVCRKGGGVKINGLGGGGGEADLYVGIFRMVCSTPNN